MSISRIAVLALSLSMLISTVLVSNVAAGNSVVGGLPVPIDKFELFGELAKQYSLWLIPSISAIGIAAFLIKRKL